MDSYGHEESNPDDEGLLGGTDGKLHGRRRRVFRSAPAWFGMRRSGREATGVDVRDGNCCLTKKKI